MRATDRVVLSCGTVTFYYTVQAGSKFNFESVNRNLKYLSIQMNVLEQPFHSVRYLAGIYNFFLFQSSRFCLLKGNGFGAACTRQALRLWDQKAAKNQGANEREKRLKRDSFAPAPLRQSSRYFFFCTPPFLSSLSNM